MERILAAERAVGVKKARGILEKIKVLSLVFTICFLSLLFRISMCQGLKYKPRRHRGTEKIENINQGDMEAWRRAEIFYTVARRI